MNAVASTPVAVVTGGSSGIGLALAREFAVNGYDLVIVAEQASRLEAAADELRELEEDPDVRTITADLSSSEGVWNTWQQLREGGRQIDILAANAGIGVSGDFARETDLDAELALIQLNVTSQVHLIKLVAGDMVARGAGDILITSSIVGTMPGPYNAVYAASKAFLKSFGQAIRQELKDSDSNVNVTVLMPGATDTDFFERADMMDTKAGQSDAKQDPAEVAQAAYKALQKDSAHIIPGLKNKLATGATQLIPDESVAKISGSMFKPRH